VRVTTLVFGENGEHILYDLAKQIGYFGVGFISVGGFTWLQLKVPGKPVTGNWFVSQDGYERPFRQCGT